MGDPHFRDFKIIRTTEYLGTCYSARIQTTGKVHTSNPWYYFFKKKNLENFAAAGWPFESSRSKPVTGRVKFCTTFLQGLDNFFNKFTPDKHMDVA